MRKIIYNKFDKKSIAELPTVTFPGKTVVVMSESEAEKAVDFLLSNDILGVDTETRPSFKKGESHMVSLLQVSTSNICFLFRLNHIGITPATTCSLCTNGWALRQETLSTCKTLLANWALKT